MSKKLITANNFRDYVSGDKLFLTKDTIVTPGAKDKIRQAGIEIVYDNCESNCGCSSSKKEVVNLEQTIIQLLVRDFNITDADEITRIVKRIRELV